MEIQHEYLPGTLPSEHDSFTDSLNQQSGEEFEIF